MQINTMSLSSPVQTALHPHFSRTGLVTALGLHAAALSILFLEPFRTETPSVPQTASVRVIVSQSEPEPPASATPMTAPKSIEQHRLTTPAPVRQQPAPTAQPAETGKTTAAPLQPSPSTGSAAQVPVTAATNPPHPATGAYTEPRFDTAYLRNPAPAYPPLSRRMGEEGQVLLRVFVESNGLPRQMQIKTSSGSSRLDQAALDAVRRWTFTPARRGDTALAAWVIVPIVFNLRN